MLLLHQALIVVVWVTAIGCVGSASGTCEVNPPKPTADKPRVNEKGELVIENIKSNSSSIKPTDITYVYVLKKFLGDLIGSEQFVDDSHSIIIDNCWARSVTITSQMEGCDNRKSAPLEIEIPRKLFEPKTPTSDPVKVNANGEIVVGNITSPGDSNNLEYQYRPYGKDGKIIGGSMFSLPADETGGRTIRLDDCNIALVKISAKNKCNIISGLYSVSVKDLNKPPAPTSDEAKMNEAGQVVVENITTISGNPDDFVFKYQLKDVGGVDIGGLVDITADGDDGSRTITVDNCQVATIKIYAKKRDCDGLSDAFDVNMNSMNKPPAPTSDEAKMNEAGQVVVENITTISGNPDDFVFKYQLKDVGGVDIGGLVDITADGDDGSRTITVDNCQVATIKIYAKKRDCDGLSDAFDVNMNSMNKPPAPTSDEAKMNEAGQVVVENITTISGNPDDFVFKYQLKDVGGVDIGGLVDITADGDDGSRTITVDNCQVATIKIYAKKRDCDGLSDAFDVNMNSMIRPPEPTIYNMTTNIQGEITVRNISLQSTLYQPDDVSFEYTLKNEHHRVIEESREVEGTDISIDNDSAESIEITTKIRGCGKNSNPWISNLFREDKLSNPTSSPVEINDQGLPVVTGIETRSDKSDDDFDFTYQFHDASGAVIGGMIDIVDKPGDPRSITVYNCQVATIRIYAKRKKCEKLSDSYNVSVTDWSPIKPPMPFPTWIGVTASQFFARNISTFPFYAEGHLIIKYKLLDASGSIVEDYRQVNEKGFVQLINDCRTAKIVLQSQLPGCLVKSDEYPIKLPIQSQPPELMTDDPIVEANQFLVKNITSNSTIKTDQIKYSFTLKDANDVELVSDRGMVGDSLSIDDCRAKQLTIKSEVIGCQMRAKPKLMQLVGNIKPPKPTADEPMLSDKGVIEVRNIASNSSIESDVIKYGYVLINVEGNVIGSKQFVDNSQSITIDNCLVKRMAITSQVEGCGGDVSEPLKLDIQVDIKPPKPTADEPKVNDQGVIVVENIASNSSINKNAVMYTFELKDAVGNLIGSQKFVDNSRSITIENCLVKRVTITSRVERCKDGISEPLELHVEDEIKPPKQITDEVKIIDNKFVLENVRPGSSNLSIDRLTFKYSVKDKIGRLLLSDQLVDSDTQAIEIGDCNAKFVVIHTEQPGCLLKSDEYNVELTGSFDSLKVSAFATPQKGILLTWTYVDVPYYIVRIYKSAKKYYEKVAEQNEIYSYDCRRKAIKVYLPNRCRESQVKMLPKMPPPNKPIATYSQDSGMITIERDLIMKRARKFEIRKDDNYPDVFFVRTVDRCGQKSNETIVTNEPGEDAQFIFAEE